MMRSWPIVICFLAVILTIHAATTTCKNCFKMSKEEKAMFRAHSDACLPQSQVDPKVVESLLSGELIEEPALKKHVYCILLKCKVITKDGKLQKAAVLGKIASRVDAKNSTKILESCAGQSGDTPEDVAWNLFKCEYDKKAVLFQYMPDSAAPTNIADPADNNAN